MPQVIIRHCFNRDGEFFNFPQLVGHQFHISVDTQDLANSLLHGSVSKHHFLNDAAYGEGVAGQRADQTVIGDDDRMNMVFAVRQNNGLGAGLCHNRGVIFCSGNKELTTLTGNGDGDILIVKAGLRGYGRSSRPQSIDFRPNSAFGDAV